LPDGRRLAQRNGIYRLPQYRGAAPEGEVRPHHRGRPAREPRPRRAGHAGSAELQGGVMADAAGPPANGPGARPSKAGSRAVVAVILLLPVLLFGIAGLRAVELARLGPVPEAMRDLD